MKRVLLLVMVALIAVGSVFATTDFKLAVGVKNTGLDITVADSAEFDFMIDTELDVFFKDGLGMNVILGTNKFESLNIGAGFAYNVPINTNWDFVLSVGPMFNIKKGGSTFGIFSHFDFDFIGGKYFFARIGTGLDMEFIQFGGNKDATTDFSMIIPIPRVAIGWKF